MRTRRKWVQVSLSVLLPGLLFALLLAQPPGCLDRGEDSPEAVFALAQRYIQEGRYDDVWRLYSPKLQEEIGRTYEKTKTGLTRDITNRAEHDRLIRAQHGIGYDEFMTSNPRKLHATRLAVDRQTVLGWEVVGTAKIDGDRATLGVRVRPEYPTADWHFIRKDGGWLVDETPMGALNSTSPGPGSFPSPK